MRRQQPTGSIGRAGIALVVAALAAALVGAPVLGAEPGNGGGRVKVIVLFEGPPGAAEARAIRAAGGTVGHVYTLIDGIAAEVPVQALAGLRRNPKVASVEADGTVTAIEPVLAEVDAAQWEYDNAWGVTHIGSRLAHDAGIAGQGVKVAVIDTGIAHDQDVADELEPPVVDPEFSGNFVGGWNFIAGNDDTWDDNGHGTHVAGSLAAEANHYLVVGVAPEVELYALKILDETGNGDESDLIAALEWSLANDIDVVNMSLGTSVQNAALEAAVANAGAAGLLMVAASGNTITLQEMWLGCPVRYPAAYPQVLSTTFTNPNDALTGYSCTGPEVDFAAPGDNIFSVVPVGPCANCSTNGYLPLSGTSMASPHLAGAVALLLSAGITDAGTPGLVDDVRDQLCATANVGYGVQTLFGSTPIPTTDPRYPTYFGCGVVDAGQAVLDLVPPPPGNQPPVAAADGATVAEDGATDIVVLGNDSDPDLDPITVTSATDPAHGTTSVNANGTVHYAPDANWNGGDTFDYSISDGRGGTASATVTMIVTPVNDAPIANADSASVAEDGATDVAVLGNDTDPDADPLTVTSATDPAHGTTSVSSGMVHYTPDANYAGGDAFSYSISDGNGGTASATVTMTVNAVNDAPVANPDSATTAQGTPVTITVLGNDTDIDGPGLSVYSASDPPHGTVVVNANGTITYTPDAGYSGADAFGYSATDGGAVSNTATVSITVTPAPPPASTVHVGDLDRSTSTSGGRWTARVTIRVHSNTEANVSSAVVTGTWSNGGSGTASCTTGKQGTCQLSLSRLPTSTTSVTFTVTGITKSGSTYLASANHDPDADSNPPGTTIVITRP